jgi:hypothetical protein
MSDTEAHEIQEQMSKLFKTLWALIVVSFAAGTWAANLQIEVNALKTKTNRIDQIAWYVEKIANKVGVETQPPR